MLSVIVAEHSVGTRHSRPPTSELNDRACDWRRAAQAGFAAGLLQHLPTAVGIITRGLAVSVGIITRGLAVCLVAEVANVAFGLGPLVESLVRGVGL
jgi:hypothetical protein